MTFVIPQNFEELVAMKDMLDTFDGDVVRFEDDEAKYQKYLESLPRGEMLQKIKEKIGEEGIALLSNDFPYTRVLSNLPHVRHYCLWSLKGELDKNQIKNEVEKSVAGRYFAVERSLYRKSIPEIWHTHVFVEEKAV